MMRQHRKDSHDQKSRKQAYLARLLLLLMVFLSGAVSMDLYNSISRKAELMSHPYELGRLMELASVIRRSLGFGHLRSCETKVERLHNILTSTAQHDRTTAAEVAAYVASILIDGRDCNKYLVQHLDSYEELPPVYLFDEFRNIFLHDINLGPLLENEQGLMLFLLYRINPEILLFSPEYFHRCEETTEEGRRSFLVSEWKRLYGEDAPPGLFETLLKKFCG